MVKMAARDTIDCQTPQRFLVDIEPRSLPYKLKGLEEGLQACNLATKGQKIIGNCSLSVYCMGFVPLDSVGKGKEGGG